jgi:hypothetical protein
MVANISFDAGFDAAFAVPSAVALTHTVHSFLLGHVVPLNENEAVAVHRFVPIRA